LVNVTAGIGIRSLSRTLKLSRDAKFLGKLTDVAGLYMNPPDQALVLCWDEKSQIQAFERTQPGLPLAVNLSLCAHQCGSLCVP
jgi:hypothetical protein